MTKEEFLYRVNKEGIPLYLFCLDDGMLNDRFCLNATDKGWAVYYSERGSKYDEKLFSTEHDALDYLYKQIRNTFDHM